MVMLKVASVEERRLKIQHLHSKLNLTMLFYLYTLNDSILPNGVPRRWRQMRTVKQTIQYKPLLTRRLQRRSLRLPTRSKSAQTGHLCTTAQAGADPGIFVCRSKFPGLKVGRRS